MNTVPRQKITLSAEEKKKLQTLLAGKAYAWQVMKRLEAIRLVDKGCTTAMIAEQLAIRKEQVRKYYQEYSKGGLDGLIRLEKPGRETLLTEATFRALEQFAKAQKKLKKRCTLKDLTMFLSAHYDISISEEWLSKRLAMRKQALKDQPWR
jgi:transposase